ncbi:unnamed protein product [Blepharisma stoltei]|uniref:Uncharacterized protein n=1 Tax=Blepharisma stoltei TaxID=1481888 RepID=A0AAU9IK89_9CILI|nr:unnamed protein product [Blepharisma stoltei]
MNSAAANSEKQASKKNSTFKVIRDLSKEEFTLRGFTFRRIYQDFYRCDTCNDELNFALIPAHTKNHQKPNKKAPQKSNPKNYTEILEYEVPNKGLVYVKSDAKKSKKKAPKSLELDLPENEEEYCSENSNSEASQGSSDPYSEPPDSENSSGDDSPKIKKEEGVKKASEKAFRKHFNLSDSDSLTSSSGDSTQNVITDAIDRERNVDFYKCSCGDTFHTYRKFKIHCSMKKSTCERCGQISYCRSAMKSHHVICLTKELGQIKWGQKSMVPHPRYLRGIEEKIRKAYAVMKKDYSVAKEIEQAQKEDEEYTWLPRKRRSKY